jgi:hypothetical protein
MSWGDKLKIKEYCYNCSELTTLNKEKGVFHYELAYEAQEEDTEEIIKNFWGGIKEVKKIKGKWINYKCPNCNEKVSFIQNEQTQKWERVK